MHANHGVVSAILICTAAAIPCTARDVQGAHTSPYISLACAAPVDIPDDESVYKQFSDLKNRQMYAICPVNVHAQRKAQVFLFQSSKTCGDGNFLGLKIVKYKIY